MSFWFTNPDAFPVYSGFYNQFYLIPIVGDGNCFWRAIAHFVKNDEERYKQVKEEVTQTILNNTDFYTSMLFDNTKGIMDGLDKYIRKNVVDLKTYLEFHVNKDGCYGGSVLDIYAVMITYRRPLITFFIDRDTRVRYQDNTIQLKDDEVATLKMDQPIRIFREKLGGVIPHYDVMVPYDEPIPNDKLIEIFKEMGMGYKVFDGNDVVFVGETHPVVDVHRYDMAKEPPITADDVEMDFLMEMTPEDRQNALDAQLAYDSRQQRPVFDLSVDDDAASSKQRPDVDLTEAKEPPITVDDVDMLDMTEEELQIARDAQFAYELSKQN